ncbi:tryptophan synthase subunit alpha [Methanosarcina sp. KYL-1]|uniref:tryptophan synthase subunit alpha n=1 Tax=Methanosarcina sp. KYL-1 TaxID=2602068 RepID=UPI002100F53E|nr:tryptophan synthase subunit alpha [Methanosarcina sp. KYL-1]MCQ1535776.1 tryptophan synthase subunit alpha [Methanosarcina sp. KYL-1]
MSRQNLSGKFGELRAKAEGALIGYLMAGDPSPKTTPELVQALARGGADVIELGLPFSDPVADGPTIQAAGQRALAAGLDIEGYFELAEALDTEVPLVCMTYYNPVFRYGPERFVERAAKAGISGLIVPDLPVEEAAELHEHCKKHGLDLIFLVAPTTPDARVRKILEKGSGFVYLVARLGVTGARADVSNSTTELLSRVETDLPKAVGFGISTGEQAAEVRKAGADAVIVGSAFVKIIEEGTGEGKDVTERDVSERLEALARELKSGMLGTN